MTLEQIFAMVDARCAAERADAISKWRGHRIRAGIIRARRERERGAAPIMWWSTGGGGDWSAVSAIRWTGGPVTAGLRYRPPNVYKVRRAA
jgi:hypothetical protein